jgi:hypothetical protein
MRNAPDLRIQGTFPIFIVFVHSSGVFYLYLLSFCSLQYIYEDLYRSYSSVCLWNPQRQPEILSLSYLADVIFQNEYAY